MIKNVGKIDRIIRVVIGLILASLMTVNLWIGIVGLAITITGLVGWCGLYKLVGINTCPIKK